jgi:Fic family protein
MKPPYSITPAILQLIGSIAEKIGEINASHLQLPKTELRKSNRIKTIQSSLEIEGNTLSIEQVTALLDNKKIVAPKKDILEVKNAIKVYDQLEKFDAKSLPSFLKAHALLLSRLIPSAGKIRTGNVGIAKGPKMAHIAPHAQMVKPLLNELFNYIKKDKDPILIKSCVFHYELEFIHPFSDGNGRMGRLWQTILLKQQYPVFSYLPVESIIKKRQKEYYQALATSDKAGNSTSFIQFMLGVLDTSLEELLSIQQPALSSTERMELFKTHIGKQSFTRKDYLRHFKEISPATASRDLKEAVDHGVLKKKGDKRITSYTYKNTSF